MQWRLYYQDALPQTAQPCWASFAAVGTLVQYEHQDCYYIISKKNPKKKQNGGDDDEEDDEKEKKNEEAKSVLRLLVRVGTDES